jgi:hypothetical protein
MSTYKILPEKKFSGQATAAGANITITAGTDYLELMIPDTTDEVAYVRSRKDGDSKVATVANSVPLYPGIPRLYPKEDRDDDRLHCITASGTADIIGIPADVA